MADTHYYIDVGLASGDDDGSTPANAWQLMAAAGKGMQYAAFNAATRNLVWIRRTSVHTMGADINFGDDGTPPLPILFIGWPRPAIPNTTITEGEFTNGSNIITGVVGITIDRESHMGRFITAPDGGQYLITAILREATVDGMAGGAEFTVGSKLTNTTQTKYGKLWGFTDNADTTGTIQYVRSLEAVWAENDNITDADGGDAELSSAESTVGFLIDREYAGSTVTGTDGKFQIEADEDYDDRPAAAKAAWDGDAIALPQIDGNSADFSINNGSDLYYGLKNIEFLNGGDATYGFFNWGTTGLSLFKGCLFAISSAIDEDIFYIAGNGMFHLHRCIFEGGGAVSVGQKLIRSVALNLNLKDCAIYGAGDNGISMESNHTHLIMHNVNLGIEMNNEDNDIASSLYNTTQGVDVRLGGTKGDIYIYTHGPGIVNIENYQKVLGDHKTWFAGGIAISTAVSGETPNNKLSDTVLKITPNLQADFSAPAEQEWHHKIPLGEINADAGSQTFKFWIYNNTGVTLNDGNATANFYLQADYVSGYGDATAYTMSTATSAEHTIADAADADDWDSLSVTITPAVESKVRLYLRISIYDTNDIFVDPQVVIT